MQLGCPRCHERQTVAASLLATGEARVRCSGCGTWFQVRVRGAVDAPPPTPSEAAPASRWCIRRRDETIIQFPSIRALYDYVVQGVVTIDDEISRGGKRWRPLRDVPELHGLFDAADVRVLPAEVVLESVEPVASVVAEPEPEPELEPVLMAEELIEVIAPLPAEPPPRASLRAASPPPATPSVVAAPPPATPAPRHPEVHSVDPELWLRRGIEDLGAVDGVDEGDEVDAIPPRSSWGVVTVVLLLVAVAALAVWRFGFHDDGEPIHMRTGETLAPSERGAAPEPSSSPVIDGGVAAEVAAVDAIAVAPEPTGPRGPEEPVEQTREAVEPPPEDVRPPVAADPTPEPAVLGYDALMRRGNELLATNPAAAIAHFQRAMAMSASVEPVAKIGWAYLNQGRPNDAILWFEKAMARSTRYASTYEGMGRALERTGRRADAIRTYETYLESFPVGGQATRVRAALERLRGVP